MARLAAILLATAAGYTDGFALVRYDVFAANMTGNIVLLSIASVDRHFGDVLRHAGPISAFMLGAMASRLLREIDDSGTSTLVMSAAALGAFAALDPMPAQLAAAALAAVMGAQNGALTRFGGVSLNTAFLTGDLQRLGQTLADPKPRRSRWSQALTVAATIAAYSIGAGAGAASVGFKAPALLVPAALLLVTSGVAYSMRHSDDLAASA